MSELFAPPATQFRAVSPKLGSARLLVAAFWLGIPALVGILVSVLVTAWVWIPTGVTVALLLWLLWLIPRQVRALMWAVTDTDFLIRRGIMFRKMVVVPFGRIQYADVEVGPLLRRFGLATVTVNTAAPSSGASLPGLPAAQASELRALLVANGRDELSGL